jgi:branched-chain amino acid transport system substrate-binding protein
MMQKSWSHVFALTMGLPLVLVMLVACGSGTGGSGGNTPPAGSTTIKIATELPVSGKSASYGKGVEDGAHLAVDQANAHHTIPGYTLVFDPKDDVGPTGLPDLSVGVQNVTSLIGDALVAGIVGPFTSSAAKAEMPIANQAPIAIISPATTNPCLTKQTAESGCSGSNDLIPTLRPAGKVTYFRIATTDDHQGPAGADYLYKTLHLSKAYVIDDTSTYGLGIANAFIKAFTADGGTVLGHSSEPETTTSYTALLTQVASKHPDVIYFGGIDVTGGTLIRQQMQQVAGLKNLPFAGGDGILSPSFASTIGLTGGPAYGTVAVVDTTTNASAAAFRSEFTEVYGNDLNVYSAAAYDCANILIQAIKTALAHGAHTPRNANDAAGAKSFRQAVIDALKSTSYEGITGHQAFDANGDTTNKIISIYKLAANTSGKPDWIFADQVTVS